MAAVLVTAGGTRNPIDAVRAIAAASTGTTGIAISRRLAALGHDVWMLGSVEAHLRARADGGPPVDGVTFEGTLELGALMRAWVERHPAGAVVHAAAVGDYAAATNDQAHKTPSGMAEWRPLLVPTPKLADHVRGWGSVGPFVTFKAASPETTPDALTAIAQAQRARTRSDLVFANVLGQLERVQLVTAGEVRYARREEAIEALVRWVDERLRSP
jgi:phosphopantothenoylcysteine decarboxylase/phosphopantothenate--cysteine ligase